MTASSFVLGVLPLVLATGPGAVGRQSVSMPILGGMLLASSIGIILVPLFFITAARFVKQHAVKKPEVTKAQEASNV